MKKYSKSHYTNSCKVLAITLFGLVVGVALSGSVFAATSVSVGGICFKGGSTIQISWTLDPSAAHGYHSIWQGTNQPTYANGQPSIVGGHFATSPLSWTLPNITASGYQSHVESHTPSHSVISSALSSPFAIDASAPTTPTLSASGVTTSSVSLSWNASTDAGCSSLSGYKIYRAGQLLTTVVGTSYTDSGLTASTSYSYTVIAYDGFDVSSSSNMVTATTSTVAPTPAPSPTPTPTAPTVSTTAQTNSTPTTPTTALKPSGTINCADIGTTALSLTYTSVDATQASLFQGGKLLASFTPANKSGKYAVTGLAPATAYDFSLRSNTTLASPLLVSVSCKTLAAPASTQTATPAASSIDPVVVTAAKTLQKTVTKATLPVSAVAAPAFTKVSTVVGGITAGTLLISGIGAAVYLRFIRGRNK